MISGLELMDNVWLVILLIRAKQFYTDSGDPGWKVKAKHFSPEPDPSHCG
jgi:hypothetical protein